MCQKDSKTIQSLQIQKVGSEKCENSEEESGFADKISKEKLQGELQNCVQQALEKLSGKQGKRSEAERNEEKD